LPIFSATLAMGRETPRTKSPCSNHPPTAPSFPRGSCGTLPAAPPNYDPAPANHPTRRTPPPPSNQFRAAVENLKISGVRGGANPRVFIGGTSYQVGDLVNPQLGIILEGYNAETRMLTFRDKTGAKVERRH